jgi:hypothetical protein
MAVWCSDDHIDGMLGDMARNRVVSATEFKAKYLAYRPSQPL